MLVNADILYNIRDIVWGVPLLVALLAVGLWQTIVLRGIQFRYLGHALKLVLRHGKELQEEKEQPNTKKVPGEISSFQALMTALAGAIGAGNITGIATAVSVGGFGALFWMIIIALLGMATAYSEAVLAVKYRVINADGHVAGGPMYTLARGLNAKKLALLFAFFGILASFTTGCMIQSNSVVDAVVTMLPMDIVSVGTSYVSVHVIVGLIIAIVVGGVLVGGIGAIGTVAGLLVPFMAISYLLAGLIVIGCNIENLFAAVKLIVHSAFTGQAATGAFVGSSIMMAMRMGVSKGIFSNEA
ncbi:MAG: sodium:alanine symporter family protein, partial [Legionellales bacterium]